MSLFDDKGTFSLLTYGPTNRHLAIAFLDTANLAEATALRSQYGGRISRNGPFWRWVIDDRRRVRRFLREDRPLAAVQAVRDYFDGIGGIDEARRRLVEHKRSRRRVRRADRNV